MKYQIEVFCDRGDNANTYLIYNDASCIIIDPANDNRIMLKFIGNRKVQGIFLTHGHYDHFKSLKDLLNKTDALVYMHKNAYNKLTNIEESYAKMFNYPYPTEIEREKVIFVNDGENIKLDNFNIKCWYTPGHSDCMMSYILDDNLFSGDFIFKESVGRTDLLTSNAVKMYYMVEELKKRKINYQIYPGHDSSTNLEYEKEHNFYLTNSVILIRTK